MKQFLIVGFGGAGQREMNIVIRLFPDCQIAIWDTGKQPALLPTNVISVKSTEEALAFNPEGVFISTPTSTHLDYAQPFLGKVKFILIDKPLDSSINKCEVFVRNSHMSKTAVCINFQRRFLPCWQTLRKCIQGESNGELLYGKIQIGSYYPDWRPHKKPSELYAAKADLGGGVLLTECHELDLLQWMLGPVLKVNAKTQNPKEQNGIENNASLLLSVGTPFGERTISVILDFLSLENRRIMELHFEHAIYVVNELDDVVHKISNGEGVEVVNMVDVSTANPHEILLHSIVKKENGVSDENDIPLLEDGLAVNAIVHAATKSNKSGLWEPVAASACPPEGVPFLNEAIRKLQDSFCNRLIAVYGLGSLGYGGYIEGWSDFDIDVLIDTSYENAKEDYETGKMIEKEIQQMGFERIDIRVYSPEHLNARKTVLAYGQCSRACMICDSAILLAGQDIRGRVLRPSQNDLNEEALNLLKNMTSKPDSWWSALPWDDIAAHFSLPARFIYTRDTGQIAGKQLALEYFIDKAAQQFNKEALQWVLWALACRLKYNPLLIQNALHEDAVRVLRSIFIRTLEIFESELEN